MDPIRTLYERMSQQGFEAVRGFKPPPLRFRASESSDCPRKIFHRLQGARPAPDTPTSMIYGWCGDVDHDLTRQMFDHYNIPVSGIVLNEDGSVEETESMTRMATAEFPDGNVEIEFSARLDGLITTERGFCVLEIKGTGFNSYKWLNDAWRKGGEEAVLERVKEKHRYWYTQCQVSMYLIQQKHPEIQHAYLVVKDRSSGALGFFDEKRGHGACHIPFDPAELQAIIQRMGVIRRALDTGTPPMRRIEGSLDCTWCPFHYLCYGMEDRRRKKKQPEILYPGPQIDIHE